MKKIIFLLIISIFVIFIYYLFRDKKVYYFSINDYISNYSYNDYINDYLEEKDIKEEYINYTVDRIKDLINSINNNEYIDDKRIKNILIKADLVTISIGLKEISKIDLNEYYEYINNYIVEIEDLFKLLRLNCKEKIVFIGYFNYEKDIKYEYYINYLNKMVEGLCDKYNIIFVHIEDIAMYYDSKIKIEGEYTIFNKIRNIVDKDVILSK